MSALAMQGRSILMFLILLSLVIAAFLRNAVWHGEILLWSDVVDKSPNNSRGLYNLALNLHNQKRLDEALGYLEKIIKLKKEN